MAWYLHNQQRDNDNVPAIDADDNIDADNVLADEWFTHLGGTEENINTYCNQCARRILEIEGVPDIHPSNNQTLFDTLSRDILRAYVKFDRQAIHFETCVSHNLRIFRIAYLYYTNQPGWQNQPSVGYTQGEIDMLVAIYCKFLRWHPGLHSYGFCPDPEVEIEAKIYYVFSEFIRVKEESHTENNILSPENTRIKKCLQQFSSSSNCFEQIKSNISSYNVEYWIKLMNSILTCPNSARNAEKV